MLESPPKSLQDLHELFLELSLQPGVYRLGDKTMAALRGLLAQPKKAAHQTITELAEQFDVSPATLTRLARRLAFSNFNQFQELFKDSLSTGQGSFYSAQATRLLRPGSPADNADPGNRAMQRLRQLAQENIQNIQSVIHNLDSEEFIAAAQTIATAQQVRLHGKRQYSALAQFLVYGLSLIRPRVSLLDPNHLGIAEGLAQMQAGDVLITASVRPYTKEVLQVSHHAAQQGITLITLTDHQHSPMAQIADFAFLIPCQSSFYSNSISAYFVFAESLLNQVAWALGDQAMQSIKSIESNIQALKIETQH